MIDFTDQVAIVTGEGRGFGRVYAMAPTPGFADRVVAVCEQLASGANHGHQYLLTGTRSARKSLDLGEYLKRDRRSR